MLRFRNNAKWAAFALALAAGCASASMRPGADLAQRGRWRAGTGSPDPVTRERGAETVFSMPFATTRADRFYWDLEAALDVSDAQVIELDISCDRPESMRALAVYFESDDGWYVWSRPIPRPGRQTLRMARSEFSTEGSPGGWDRIRRIRISPWAGSPVNAQLVLHGMGVRQVSVLVLRSTRSSPNDAERNVAEAVARRVSGWLDLTGIAHAVADEDGLNADALAGVRTVILPYNATLPADLRAVLTAFSERGGRLVVFYSADAELARHMGFRLGEYKRAERPGRWAGFRFEDPARWQTPERVGQHSNNIRPAWPDANGTHVIAWWENARGERAPEPAWTAGPRGIWMSHVLLSEDARGKTWMLAGLLASRDDRLWPDIAAALTEWCGRIDSFSGYDEAVAWIRREARRHAGELDVRRILDEADRLHARLKNRRSRGGYGGFLADAFRVRDLLTEAYGRVHQPMAGEFRGVWDHSGAGWYPGDWDRSAEILAQNGMTAIFPNLLWAGRAHFPSDTLPGSDTLRLYGDQAEAVMRAARRHGLEVHAWKVCWNLSAAPAELVEQLRAEGRLQADAQGRTTPWLSPAHPENIEFELAGIREMVRRYRPDGIHLDYIRFPDRNYCYGPASRRAYEARRGRPVDRWPADVIPGGALRNDYEAWRRELITGFVRKVRDEIRAIDPGVRLSAAVFGSIHDARVTIAQDWVEWLRLGLVDFVVPMNYTENLSNFTALTRTQLERARGLPGRVYPGIGVSSNEAALWPDQVIEQVARGRSLGAGGFVLFDLNPDLRDQTLPALRLGLTREHAGR